ncbi:MAG: T9SS type A sorting domain-containing protein, partial [Crocinitomicaceae bacterium]|nr:T9SS type A sorting domain-containing protein [Crocinitomicaceae bacterium]
ESILIIDVLPVGLVDFTVSWSKDRKADLHWTTVSESNNQNFILFHSLDFTKFKPIGSIEGSGTSNKTIQYNYLHESPSLHSTNYYFLKQYDFDGVWSQSQVIQLSNSILNSEYFIYPNPTNGIITAIGFGNSDLLRIRLVDACGQNIDIRSSVKDQETAFIIDIHNINTGIYYLSISGNIYKIIKI